MIRSFILAVFLLLSSFVGISQSNIGIYSLATASGTDTYTANVTPTFTAYVSGQRFNIKFTNANTGAATININSKGAKSILHNGGTPLIAAGQIMILQYDGVNMQIIGDGGAPLIFSSTAPSTSAVWVDTGNAANQAYPMRRYVNGAWTPVADECDWWDTIGGVVSKGKPIAILFSGQSNVGTASDVPADNPTYLGDVTVSKYVTLWQPTTDVFRVFDYADATTRGNRTWTYPLGTATDDLWGAIGTNQLWQFGKLYAKRFNRSVRFVGTRRGGQVLSQWEATKTAWTELVAEATASGINRFDAFIWIHGEAEHSDVNNPSAFTNYKDCFYDLVSRLKTQSWADEKLKVIAPSHGLNSTDIGGHSTNVLSPNGDLSAEGTIRSLDNQDNPYYAWAQIFTARETKQGAVDPYHFTTREHERMGAAIFETYLSLPNYRKSDRLYRTFYTNSANRLTSIISTIPNTNSFEIRHSGGNSQTARFERGFSATGGTGYIADIKEVIRGTGANFVTWEIQSSATTPGTLEAKLQVATNGVTIPKLINISGQSTIGSDPVSAITFLNGGGTANDIWIARDGVNQWALSYKAGQSGAAEGAHKFYLGEFLAGQFYWRTPSNFDSYTFDVNADLRISRLGQGLYIKEGTNATMGTATLVGGTVTVSNTKVTASSRIFLTIQSLGTVTSPKAIAVTARIAGTSFTITSADGTDTSVVAWQIIEGF